MAPDIRKVYSTPRIAGKPVFLHCIWSSVACTIHTPRERDDHEPEVPFWISVAEWLPWASRREDSVSFATGLNSIPAR